MIFSAARSRWPLVLLPLVVGLLAAPMVLTSRSYASDWANHLWVVWQQSLNIDALGHPSYFLQTSFGTFYPWYAFNGGTLYTAVGGVSALTGGHALAAYVAAYVAAFTASYAGWLWLCRQVGLEGWRAHLPAILFVTSSYYVDNVYGRGDFPEVIGTSAIPLVVAGAYYLLGAPRWKPLPVAAFLLGVVFLTGSHTITTLWGATFIVIAALITAAAAWRYWRPSLRRVTGVVGVGLLGVAINAWYLFPALAYQTRLLINDEYPGITQVWFTKTSHMFSLLRDTARPAWIHGDVQAQLPTLAIAWALIVAVVAWPRVTPLARRLAVGVLVLLVLFTWLILAPRLLAHLGPWQHVEFPFRLVTYATLAACALVLVSLLLLERLGRRIRTAAHAALALITVFSVGLAVQEMWHAPSFLPHGRDQVFASSTDPPVLTWYYGHDYADRSLPVIAPSLTSVVGGTPLVRRPGILLPPTAAVTAHDFPITVPRAGTVATNVAGGPYVVKVKGATPVGRTGNGMLVLRVDGSAGHRHIVSFGTAASVPLRAGIVVTLLSLLAVLALLVTTAGRVHSRSQRGPEARAEHD